MDVVDLLEEVGVKDVKCTLIKAKDGCIFNTAAFKGERTGCVQRYLQQRGYVPVDSEVRDWIFYPRLPDDSLSGSKSTVNR